MKQDIIGFLGLYQQPPADLEKGCCVELTRNPIGRETRIKVID